MKDKKGTRGVARVLRPLSCFNKEPSEHSADADADLRFTGLRDECDRDYVDANRIGCVPLRRSDKQQQQQQQQQQQPEEAHSAADGWRFLLNSELPAELCGTAAVPGGQLCGTAAVAACADPDPSGRTEQRTFTLCRSGPGFGFTLVGSQPVRVGKVDLDSTAGRAGVRSGDIVVGINGENVLSCNCDRVVHIIRQCQQMLEIRIQRWLESEQQQQQQQQQQQRMVHEDFSTLSIRRRAQWHRHQRSAVSQIVQSPQQQQQQQQQQQLCSSRGCSTPPASCMNRAYDSLIKEPHRLGSQQLTQQLLQEWRHSAQSVLLPDCQQQKLQQQQQQQQQQLWDASELQRQAAVQQLLSREEQFAQAIGSGRQLYCRQLSRLLTPQEMRTLFFNMEAMQDCSVSIARHIRSSSAQVNGDSVDNVGQIYRSRVFHLCDLYREYGDNLQERVVPLLQSVCSGAEYQEMLRCGRSLNACLLKPIFHLRALAHEFKTVLRCTHAAHYDFMFAEDVSQNLEHCAASLPQAELLPLPTASPTAHSLVASSSGVSSEHELLAADCDQRHLVFSGELLWHRRLHAAAVCSVHALLLTDLLIFTQRRPDATLTVLADPLQLADCCHAQFDFAHNDRMFQLAFAGGRAALLEAPAAESKEAWRKFISHRIRLLRQLPA